MTARCVSPTGTWRKRRRDKRRREKDRRGSKERKKKKRKRKEEAIARTRRSLYAGVLFPRDRVASWEHVCRAKKTLTSLFLPTSSSLRRHLHRPPIKIMRRISRTRKLALTLSTTPFCNFSSSERRMNCTHQIRSSSDDSQR